MSILVLGAGGMVGSALASLPGCHGLGRDGVDITDDGAFLRALDAHRPASVVNCAALANVDRCDREAELAWQVNAEAPGRLAAACAGRGIRFVHVSTDYVLTGPDEPTARLVESCPPDPRSTYARSKRAGEIGVLAHDALVVRVQWVYGVRGRGFFSKAMALLRDEQPVRLVVDQVGTPTEVTWLASRLRDAAAGGPTGLFHLAPDGEASAWEWIITAAAAQGIPTASATGMSRADLPGAFRPARSCLDNARFREAWPAAWPRWDEALRASLSSAGSGD